MTKKHLGAATFMACLLASGAALADDAECSVPLSDWQPKSAVSQMAKAKGWDVRRIKTDDGCYRIKALDGEGREFEATVDPSNLQLLRTEREDDDDEGEDDEESSQAPVPGTQTLRTTSTPAPSGKSLLQGNTLPKVQVN